MTIEELLDCSADKLEKMTDAELEEFFKPYLDTTRPELALIKRMNDGVQKKKAKGGGGIGELLALQFLAKAGIKLSK